MESLKNDVGNMKNLENVKDNRNKKVSNVGGGGGKCENPKSYTME